MLQPSKFPLTLPIPPGSTFSFTAEITDEDDNALDVTDYLPFIAQIRDSPNHRLLGEFTIDDSDAANGVLVFAVTLSANQNIPVDRAARWDLIDKFGGKWIYGPVDLSATISQLP